MSALLGLNSKMYYNTGTEASPTWVELGNATNRNFALTSAETDVTTFDSNGWRTLLATLKEGSVDFGMIADTTDVGFARMSKAWLRNESVEMLILDRAMTIAGANGLHAVFNVFATGQDIPSPEAAITANVTLKPTYSSTLKPFWQVTYQAAEAVSFAAGANVYVNTVSGLATATTTDVFVGRAVYAASAGALVYVDVSADAAT